MKILDRIKNGARKMAADNQIGKEYKDVFDVEINPKASRTLLKLPHRLARAFVTNIVRHRLMIIAPGDVNSAGNQ